MVTKLLERMGGADKPVLNRGDKSPLPIFKKKVVAPCGDYVV